MGIYIKDMKMPQRCEDCVCFSFKHRACGITGSWIFTDESGFLMDKLPDCPLIEVQEEEIKERM